MARHRVRIFYSGKVQGVGFRYTVKSVATGYEVVGEVKNLADGRVELVAEGDQGELEEFLKAIRESELRMFIRGEEADWGPAEGFFRGFVIAS